jgi:spermidine/putrescine transport system permease protein
MNERLIRLATRVYLALFFVYLLFPLGYLMLLAFNDSRIPTHRNFTPTLKWFGEAWANQRMWDGLENSLWIAALVLFVSIPLGLAGAVFLVRFRVPFKPLVYAVLISPILAPGIVLGISAFIFWSQQLGFRAGWWTAALAQSSFIAAYCMLIFMARLQRFDATLEEAGLDLGATPWQVFTRITVPYMRPALFSAGALAFLQSFENFTTTYFAIGAESTFTIFIANSVRQGVTPAVNAVAVVIVTLTVLAAIGVEWRRRRAERLRAEARRRAEQAAIAEEVLGEPAAAPA